VSEIPSVHAGGITGADLGDDPIEHFRTWLEEAREAGVLFPEAAALATADARGRPAVRHVLVKGADERLESYRSVQHRGWCGIDREVAGWRRGAGRSLRPSRSVSCGHDGRAASR
jgi:hypothetical protein